MKFKCTQLNVNEIPETVGDTTRIIPVFTAMLTESDPKEGVAPSLVRLSGGPGSVVEELRYGGFLTIAPTM